MDLVVSEGRIPQTTLTSGHQANGGENIQETTPCPLRKIKPQEGGRAEDKSPGGTRVRGLSQAPAFLNRRHSMALKGAGWCRSTAPGSGKRHFRAFPATEQGRRCTPPGGRLGLAGSCSGLCELHSPGPPVRSTLLSPQCSPGGLVITLAEKLTAGPA